MPARRLHVREHLEAAVGAGGAERHRVGLHRRRRVAAAVLVARRLRRRQPVDAGHEREVVAVEVGARHGGGAAPRVGPDPDDERAVRLGVVDDAVAERGLEPGEERLELGIDRIGLGLGLGFRLGVDRGLGRVGRARSAPRPRSAAVGPRCASGVSSAIGPATPVPASRSSTDDVLAPPALRQLVVADALGLDPLLEHHDRVEQRLGPRRAAGDVDVDRDDLVDALGDRVRVPVRAAAVGARAHRDHVLRVGHLLVEALDRRRHLVGDGARDHHEVGLAGARRERDDAEAHHVVAGAGQRRAHLDRAAGQAPLEHPEAVLAAVVEEPGDRLQRLLPEDALLD